MKRGRAEGMKERREEGGSEGERDEVKGGS